MITIEEKLTTKLPGLTSLYVKFNYNKDVVEAIKECFDTYTYEKKNYTWEVSIKGLSKFLDTVCKIDTVSMSFLNEEVQEDKKYELMEYKTTPFNYQLEGIQYGLNHDNFLLLDAPGLGKTLTAIYLAQELKERENLQHCLIICGINTLKNNWKKEIEKHSNLSSMILGTRKFKKKDGTYIGSMKDRVDDLKSKIDEFFVITNIETLRSDEILHELTHGKANKFDMIVLDEVHKCKDHNSQQGKHLLKLKDAKHKIGLTGTVLLNSPLDAYVPLKWIGVDKSNYTNYRYFYCNYDSKFGNYVTGYKNIDVLKNQLDRCSLRRTKDILDLPPKNIIHEYVDMDLDQQRFYENLVNGELSQIDRVSISNESLLSMVVRMMQATACPQVLTTENISSAKVDRAIDIAKQILDNNEKVVIFSRFKPTLDPIMRGLADYNPLLCTGDVKDDVISKNIDAFQNNDINRVMCCSISKMGTGITLTRASYAIFIDCAWTAAENTQCEDRIYRIGSKSPVFIYYLWTNDTFDIHVKEIVDDKSMMSDYIVDNKIHHGLIDRLKNIIVDL